MFFNVNISSCFLDYETTRVNSIQFAFVLIAYIIIKLILKIINIMSLMENFRFIRRSKRTLGRLINCSMIGVHAWHVSNKCGLRYLFLCNPHIPLSVFIINVWKKVKIVNLSFFGPYLLSCVTWMACRFPPLVYKMRCRQLLSYNRVVFL